jgi:hypothetical protein
MMGDSAEVRTPLDTHTNYGGEFSAAMTLAPVLFQQNQDAIGNGYALASGVKGKLFIDATNTVGAFELPVGTLVRINNEDSESCVTKCTACKAFGRIHHWECELS